MESFKMDSRLVLLHVGEPEKSQVLKKMFDRLLCLGYVKESFYDALLAREREYPTGIPGQHLVFAMPHTYPEHVNKPGICIALCDHDIPFVSMEDRERVLPCRVILMLAMTDPQQHLALLRRLMDVTRCEELAQKLKTARTADEVLSVFA